ncbi:hypothetical protein E2562_004666 [Oryza meyeriana var. granulata]|uniref:Reverse transcriptase Ty1/copia-type domain-containing protein n=1 Tax=Oryza meyeriana var. granulata TaxID=110450 RepID=A0A6G1DET1_9ORYZ|nr:hypothetical protein E2562_004666 [Oryza meyeriana var. granulata]
MVYYDAEPTNVDTASPTPPPSGDPTPEPAVFPSEPISPQMEFVSPPTADPNLDDDQGAPRRYRSITNINSTTEPVELDSDELCLLAAKEPCTFAEADHDENWRKAMHEEMNSIEDNRTWDLFTRSSTEHAVYTRGTGAARLVIGVYIDDLIINVRGRVERSYREMASASRLMHGMASVGNARRMVMARMADGHYG